MGGEEGVRGLITNSEFKLEVHELFAKLLEEPLAKCRSPPNRRLVIIDALDETAYGSRKDFLNVIKLDFPRLPEWLVFFITSRPEEQIQSRLSRYKPCIKMCAGIHTDRGNFYQHHEKDIQRYLDRKIDFSVLSVSLEDVTKKCGGLLVVRERYIPTHTLFALVRALTSRLARAKTKKGFVGHVSFPNYY